MSFDDGNKKPKIMIVEDEVVVATEMRTCLEELGYTVSAHVASGAEAVERAEKERPDIILMDIVLWGDMDGIEAAQLIHSKMNIPIIYITAYTDEERLKRAKVTEPFGYMIKPFQDREVKATIEMALYKMETEARLRESEEKFRVMMEAMDDPAYICSSDYRITYMNPAMIERTGRSAIGEYCHKAINALEDKCPWCVFEKVIKGEHVRTVITSPRDGRCYHVSNSPLFHVNGSISKMSVYRDITELQRIEESLAWEAQVNASIAELSSLLIQSRDIDKISNLVLERARELTGSKYGFIGYIDPENGNLIAVTMTREVWDACQVRDKNINFEHLGGLLGWILRNGQPLLTNTPEQDHRSNGVPSGHILIKRLLSVPAFFNDRLVGQLVLANSDRDYVERDLNIMERLADLYALAIDRLRSEVELVQAKNAAEASNRTKSEFLSNVSHEFRTPLNGIIGFTDLVLNSNIDQEQLDYLNIVKDSAYKLLTLVNNLIDLTQLETGSVRPVFMPFSLKSVMSEILIVHRPTAENKGLYLSDRFDPAVPPRIIGDSYLLNRILDILVENAVKFTEKGMVTLEVNKEKDEDRSLRLRFTVSDTGPGIPQERIHCLYQDFTQVDGSISRIHGGLGIGLTMVRKIVNLLNGDFWVESAEEKGSRFNLVLPFETANDQIAETYGQEK
ncbi:MAG: GAF domain-containing protein [Thermodesulfobacteriota bacterium]